MSEIKFKENMFYIEGNDGKIVAKITFFYQEKNVIVIDHTLVNKELRGRNIAGKLLNQVVELARKENLFIIPECSYAVIKLTKDDKYKDILYKS